MAPSIRQALDRPTRSVQHDGQVSDRTRLTRLSKYMDLVAEPAVQTQHLERREGCEDGMRTTVDDRRIAGLVTSQRTVVQHDGLPDELPSTRVEVRTKLRLGTSDPVEPGP